MTTLNLFLIASIGLAISLAACHTNPNYCPGAPLDNCALRQDAADGDAAAVTCTDNNSCNSAQPYCDQTSKECRACEAHSECASEVCLPSGACAAQADVAYANGAGAVPKGIDSSTCSLAAPCFTVSAALNTTAGIIKLKGSFTENVEVSDRTAQLFAAPNTKFTSSSTTAAVFRLTKVTDVEMYDLDITCNAQVSGIEIPANNPDTKMKLRRGRITRCDTGVFAASGTVSISDSVISINPQGGIRLEKSTFTIQNNFISENGSGGSGGSSFGGISVATPTLPSIIEHNTIVKNMQAATNLTGPGIDCSASISVPFNIITNNSSDIPQVKGCLPENSFVSPVSQLSLGPDNLHLTDQSPASVRDVPGLNCTGTDIDGQPRPFGNGCDLGADEYRP